MKKLFSVTLCILMVMALSVGVFAISVAPPDEMLAWYDMIDAIGEVTLEDGDAIDDIWAHFAQYGYDLFVVNIRFRPSNFKTYYDKLVQITAEYDALAAESAPSETQPSEPAPSETQPSEPAPSETKPTEPAPSETQPAEPAPSETQPTEPKPVDPNGDGTFMVIAMAILSMTALMVLVSKKRVF